MNTSASTLEAQTPTGRSILVSVLGWLAIVGGALTVLATFTQFELLGALEESLAPGMEPAAQEGLFRFLSGVTALNLILAALLTYAGYALWMRRNWARKTFIVLLALGIVANVISVAAAVSFGSLLGSLLGEASFSIGAVLVVGVIISLAFAALFYWLIRRLRSPVVKSEFV